VRQIKCDRCKRIIVHRRGGVTVLDDKIGRISISSETEVGLAGEENIGQLEDWELCPDCIEKIVKFIRNEETEEPPEELPDEKKAPEEPEPVADQREGTEDEALVAPEEKQVDLTKFEPAEVHEDKSKSSVRMITPETRKQIRDLAKDGKSAREISELTGVSIPTANKYMRRATDGQTT